MSLRSAVFVRRWIRPLRRRSPVPERPGSARLRSSAMGSVLPAERSGLARALATRRLASQKAIEIGLLGGVPMERSISGCGVA